MEFVETKSVVAYKYDPGTASFPDGTERDNIVTRIKVRYSISQGAVSVSADFVHSLTDAHLGAECDNFVELADVTLTVLESWLESCEEAVPFIEFKSKLTKCLRFDLDSEGLITL